MVPRRMFSVTGRSLDHKYDVLLFIGVFNFHTGKSNNNSPEIGVLQYHYSLLDGLPKEPSITDAVRKSLLPTFRSRCPNLSSEGLQIF